MATAKTVSGFLEKVKLASKPFEPAEHEWKPLSVSEKGAWIAYYVDMRKMMERLQQIFGESASIHLSAITGSGSNGYNVLATLTIQLEDGNTVTYQDFGYASADTAEGFKSAATDAYRRVLSHLGIGRYLYHLPKIFIGGRRNGYRFVPKRNPIDVLEDVLKNGTEERFLFIDADEEDAVWGGNRNGREQNRSSSEDKGEADGGEGKTRNRKADGWLDVLGVNSQEDAVEVLRGFAKRRGVHYTDKQLYAFIRMVDPKETSVEELETDPTHIKVLLDTAFGRLKEKTHTA